MLDAPDNVRLPESFAQEKPRETVVIFVSPDEVMVQGELVAYTADILDSGNSGAVGPVLTRLAELSGSVVGPSTKEVSKSQEVTILADKSVPFTVIKRRCRPNLRWGHQTLRWWAPGVPVSSIPADDHRRR